MTPIETLIEKQAIKELVDTFSNLADIKDVAAQGPLFTEDGHVTTYIGGELFADLKNRAEIVDVFTDFLANFKRVYHLNGQLTIHLLSDNRAEGFAQVVCCKAKNTCFRLLGMRRLKRSPVKATSLKAKMWMLCTCLSTNSTSSSV